MTEPLVTVSWLYFHLLEPSVRVVDVRWYLGEPERGPSEYATSHIPGSIYLDVDHDLSAPQGDGRHPLPDPKDFSNTLGQLGIANDHHVVVYDDASGGIASRVWWMLRQLGHQTVSVLDGGFAAWIGSEYPVTSAVHVYEPETFEPAHGFGGTIDREQLRSRLRSVTLLDARAPERYEGESEPIDPVAGHIPTALSVPYTENVGEDGRFLTPAKLTERFTRLGVDGASDVVVYCGSGVTSCGLLLALEVAGVHGAKLYPGSWSDWSTAGFPVAKGPEPGELP